MPANFSGVLPILTPPLCALASIMCSIEFCFTKDYLTIKRNKELIHVTKWKNLENIMLSVESQSQKTTCYMILFVLDI
jgi:hypothetical protein